MKSPVLETFLVDVAFGIGITVLSLYAQKPGCFVTSLETIAEMEKRKTVGLGKTGNAEAIVHYIITWARSD